MREVAITLTINEAREALKAMKRMQDHPIEWMSDLDCAVSKTEKAIAESEK